ncbi:Uncharacterised protein [Shigella flexneri]|nr:Uncharacterised protein [Shigella flexneri]
MQTNFPLLDQTSLAGIEIFHRIFQRQNMRIGMLIKIANHRRQRGRFATPRSPRHQNQAILALE